MYWGTTPQNYTFYSYYPYDSNSKTLDAVSTSVPDAQTQSSANSTAHLSALDFLVATPFRVYSPYRKTKTSGINLKYNHVFTILEFQIKGSGNFEAISLEAVNTLAFSSGTIDITVDKPASGASYPVSFSTEAAKKMVTTTLTTSAPLTGTNTDTKVYMVINPFVIEPYTQMKKCLIGLKIDGTWKYVDKRYPEGGFKRGIKYKVAIDAANAVENVVLGQAGEVWMDRNLGATRVATAVNDAQAYGDLYQYGRYTDGHEKRTSTYIATRSDTDTPGHNQFITPSGVETDWRTTTNYSLWQGVSGINNPCPAGFRIPTLDELRNEAAFWYQPEVKRHAFEGPLKIPVGGVRYYSNEEISGEGSVGNYWTCVGPDWTSSLSVTDIYYTCVTLDSFIYGATNRANGLSVRCIKD